MTRWRNPTYMRRHQMRLMAEEQQRQARDAQQRHLQALADRLASTLAQMSGMAGMDQAATATPIDPVAALATAMQDASDLDGQAALLLRKNLH